MLFLFLLMGTAMAQTGAVPSDPLGGLGTAAGAGGTFGAMWLVWKIAEQYLAKRGNPYRNGTKPPKCPAQGEISVGLDRMNDTLKEMLTEQRKSNELLTSIHRDHEEQAKQLDRIERLGSN